MLTFSFGTPLKRLKNNKTKPIKTRQKLLFKYVLSFYSTLNVCLRKVFTFFVPLPKKKCAPSQVFIPIAWCEFTPI